MSADIWNAWMWLRMFRRCSSRAKGIEDVMANLTSMMFPRTDAGLLAWSLNFSTLISATPTDYGLTMADATAYAAVHAAFGTALAACDPNARNKGAVVTKNAARTTLKNQAKLLASTIYGTATVTDSQKVTLGIPPRAIPRPVPAPGVPPVLEVLSVNAWTVKIKLHAAGSGSRRGKPAGVIGASVFSFVGATPPEDMGSWKFEGNTGRSNIDVAFDNSNAPGTKVWMTAFWFNGRKQSGPACAPVPTNLQGGSVSMAA
jgi:hypothetical protein